MKLNHLAVLIHIAQLIHLILVIDKSNEKYAIQGI